MKKIKNSRGELTTQQIVLLIILITSFSIILFFFFKLNLGQETQKTICHNSVILKGKSIPSLGGGNLDCRTNYLCISGGEDCEGINPTETIKVDSENKNEVLKSIANEMADCWWMFGEGKVDYVGGINLIDNNVCSICSIVAFDDEITQEKISYEEFYEYLKNTKKDESNTYLSYLYNVFELESFSEDYLKEELDFSKEYFVLTALGEKGALISMKDFAFGSVDSFNDLFFGFWNLPNAAGDKEYSHVPIVLTEKSKLRDLGCDEFLTKA